jgi:hypothetical protein
VDEHPSVDRRPVVSAFTDEIVDAMAVTSTWDDLPRKLLDRYGNRADQIVCYSVVEHWADDPDPLARWQDVNRRFVELREGRSDASDGRVRGPQR